MPDRLHVDELARLLGVTVAYLQTGEMTAPASSISPGALVLSPQEKDLIATYRLLEEWAQEALRGRAAQLLEDYGPKGPDNPYGGKPFTKEKAGK